METGTQHPGALLEWLGLFRRDQLLIVTCDLAITLTLCKRVLEVSTRSRELSGNTGFKSHWAPNDELCLALVHSRP